MKFIFSSLCFLFKKTPASGFTTISQIFVIEFTVSLYNKVVIKSLAKMMFWYYKSTRGKKHGKL